MAQYSDDAYGIPHYSSNRSPGSLRGSHMIYRQPSQQSLQQSLHLDTYRGNLPVQPQGLYASEEHTVQARFDPIPRYDRMASLSHHSNYPYDNQTWSYGALNGGSFMNVTGRSKPSARRPGLPNVWMDLPPSSNQNVNSIHSNSQLCPQSFHQTQRRPSPTSASDTEEIIPTALVVKNIPFAVKREQILQLMADMTLPVPYAFNYHFDQGVFRGLAFANFTSPEETKIVIEHMNSMDLNGRKLRVEYKRMLPLKERERIEREKREKRGQLEEQHRPMPPGQVQNPLHSQASMNSLSSAHPVSPSPVALRDKFGQDIDLNNPVSLGYYTDIVVFKKDPSRESLVFPASISPADRRQIHTMAHYLGLEHRSQGEGDDRCVQILKKRPAELSSPVSQLSGGGYYNESRRGLNRAATIDFSEALGNENYQRTIGRQSSGLLDIPQSPRMGGGLSGVHNLRAAKSFADLPSATPNLTPTSAGGMTHCDEFYLNNNMSNLSLFENRGNGNRANGINRISQDREAHATNAGTIGSQRPANGCKTDDSSHNGQSISLAHREPRDPGPDWGVTNGSFSRPRPNGHTNRSSVEVELNGFENGWDDNRTQDKNDRNNNLLSRTNRYQ